MRESERKRGSKAAKKYLERASWIGRRLSVKAEQLEALECIAERATSALRHAPGGGTPDPHAREAVYAGIADLRDEIGREMARLAEARSGILEAVDALDDPREETVLELRYLCGKSWGEIADALGCSEQSALKTHARALERIRVPEAE